MADITQHGSLTKDDNGMSVGWSYKNITTAATTDVKASPGILRGIVINKPGSSDTLTVYDNTAASGTKIASITVNSSTTFYPFHATCQVGLTVVSGGTPGDYTVIYV